MHYHNHGEKFIKDGEIYILSKLYMEVPDSQNKVYYSLVSMRSGDSWSGLLLNENEITRNSITEDQLINLMGRGHFTPYIRIQSLRRINTHV